MKIFKIARSFLSEQVLHRSGRQISALVLRRILGDVARLGPEPWQAGKSWGEQRKQFTKMGDQGTVGLFLRLCRSWSYHHTGGRSEVTKRSIRVQSPDGAPSRFIGKPDYGCLLLPGKQKTALQSPAGGAGYYQLAGRRHNSGREADQRLPMLRLGAWH